MHLGAIVCTSSASERQESGKLKFTFRFSHVFRWACQHNKMESLFSISIYLWVPFKSRCYRKNALYKPIKFRSILLT